MWNRLKAVVSVLKTTFREFSDDDCMSRAAALAYYTVFSLPALLVVVVAAAGLVWDASAVRGALEDEIAGMVGEGGTEQIALMMDKANDSGRGIWATIIGGVVLLAGAIGVFGQLQYALNRAWGVKPDPKMGGIKQFVTKRLLSLGMVLVVAFLLLVSLALTTGLSAAGTAIGGVLGGPSTDVALGFLPVAIHLAVSWLVITLLFAAMFKFLPDAHIAWRDVWAGAAITAVLFVAGKSLVGLYLGSKDTGAYGPAGSLVLVLLWIYYTSLIFLFGAELTQVLASTRGKEIQPEAGAVRVVQKQHVQNERMQKLQKEERADEDQRLRASA